MQKDGVVSIWTANTQWSDDDLREVTASKYSDDGDYLGSVFTNALSLDYIDDDFLEAEILAETDSIPEALRGFSYESEILNEIAKKNLALDKAIDTAVLIYNYEFDGKNNPCTIRSQIFFFLGSFRYL
ncbi:immunity 22 family protein [Pseudomonas indica]|uniref:immunity 22 family protein n=1 Tax=Pseudomonas indica TaxID=137658 RepID=UPI0023F80AEE|nr:immunity 22 family protein [Pseudomonas indica]MBU3059662.1 immunity 22 family protein [Pseudomonas indica]